MIKNKLKGNVKTNTKWIDKGSDPIGGTFSLLINGESLEVDFDESEASFVEKI